MSAVIAFEGELNSIVREYLDFGQLDKTLSVFERECTERGKPIAPSDSKPRKTSAKQLAAQQKLIELFQHGKRHDFFRLWTQLVPEVIRSEDAAAQKLEFYLNIYFAIYPLKYNLEDSEDGMNHFKVFLETAGASLSQTTEFLPYYALPYVPNPKAHPSYKDLFSERWVPDLRERLEKFLNQSLKSSAKPRLFELFNGVGGNASDIRTLQQAVHDSEKKANTYMKRYSRVQTDYHNLIGITADLVDSLEATVQGRPVSPEYLQKICMRLFSNQVRQSIDLTRPGTAAEVLRQSTMPPQGLLENGFEDSNLQHDEAVPLKSLDYDKIKKDLLNAQDRTKGLLLQALRWKLTKSPPPERDTVLASYINNDLMGLAYSGSARNSRVLSLLASSSEAVRQYMARLLNAIASLCDGRSYLSSSDKLLRSLIDNLRSESRDSLTRENILGCLQKLSLRRQMQSQMIEEGIISWLVSVLEDNDSLSDYTLEYSIALMMNLCLRSAGKQKCVGNAQQVLKVLSDLLGHENQEIIPYVNGALYSILAIPSIREVAKSMGMEEILRCFVKEGQSDMNRQIEFIIKQLNSREKPDNAESDDEEDDEDEEDADAMEPDLDKNEILKHQAGELVGDRLLYTKYCGSTSAQQKKRRPTDNVMQQEDLLMRPVTPSQRRGAETPVIHVLQVQRPATGSSRPPTGHRSSRPSSRPSSRDQIQRPPTRSGSRPNSAQETPREPPPIDCDPVDSEKVSNYTGVKRPIAKIQDATKVKPSNKAVEKQGNTDFDEYAVAFGSRPRVVRTPDVRPSSHGSGSALQPQYSDTLPTSRPNSGGRPSIAEGEHETAQRAEDTPAYDIWQRPETPESCTSLDSLSLNEHLASDYSDGCDSDSDRTVTPSYSSSSRSNTPATSYLSDRMTSSSYLPHLHQTYTPGLFPFVKRQVQRDSFYDSSRPTTRSLSNQTLQTHRSGPYGDSFRGSPVLESRASTTTPLPPDSATPHRPNAAPSPTLKWSITPDVLMPIESTEPKKSASTSFKPASSMPPIHNSRFSPSPSKSMSYSQSQSRMQSLANCQSEARKIVPSSYSCNDQSRHDFYY